MLAHVNLATLNTTIMNIYYHCNKIRWDIGHACEQLRNKILIGLIQVGFPTILLQSTIRKIVGQDWQLIIPRPVSETLDVHQNVRFILTKSVLEVLGLSSIHSWQCFSMFDPWRRSSDIQMTIVAYSYDSSEYRKGWAFWLEIFSSLSWLLSKLKLAMQWSRILSIGGTATMLSHRSNLYGWTFHWISQASRNCSKCNV